MLKSERLAMKNSVMFWSNDGSPVLALLMGHSDKLIGSSVVRSSLRVVRALNSTAEGAGDARKRDNLQCVVPSARELAKTGPQCNTGRLANSPKKPSVIS